ISARIAAAVLLAAVTMSACASPGAISGPQFATREGKVPLQRIYRLGIGDKLKVTVFGEDNLTGPLEVNALGQVSMPLIGELPAKGLALNEFRDAIARRLSEGYLKNPKVSVEMTNYRPIYVHGEVKNGGEFQFKNGVSLRDVVAMAGGYTYRADQSYLFIGREGEPDVAVQMPADVKVLPGDNIRVPERFF
ncbi:MAG: polysaccharide biosynthesis/export family protein, partial [Hyphomicrobium sp.]